MNTSSCIGISTMKPCCTILSSCKDSSFFGYPFGKCNHLVNDNLLKPHWKLDDRHRLSNYANRVIGVIGSNRSGFCGPDSNWRQSRILLGFRLNKETRCDSVNINVASDVRNYSTSIEAQVNEKSFEKFYIQGGLNVKPLIIERTESDKDVDKVEEVEEVRTDINDGSALNVKHPDNYFNGESVSESPHERELSEVEKEAWNLLRGAVVKYCGFPVGTVAANDPADKQPLNYDQVFIRDFVPSALAFLLNGEGEIVKNFLLHTLQLQALFYSALRSSREMLTINDSTKSLVAALNNRLSALSFHMREYYWLDRKKINEIYRYKTEEYSTDAINKFNIYPDQIPSWLVDWLPEIGGLLAIYNLHIWIFVFLRLEIFGPLFHH